ncbi:MAG TPA: response regulator [Gammaproteobacteria bacterium]|nr:response regulator [Gammaproteobacteria bacterium]
MTDSAAQPEVRQTILVVDDSRVIRKAVNTILADDYDIIEGSNGEEALSLLHENHEIHAMLLDLWMPDVDGFEVLETMRASSDPALQNLPVIVVTGHEDDQEMRSKAESLGATDFISKPFSAFELKDSVRRHVLPADRTNIIQFKPGNEKVEPTAKQSALTSPVTEKPKVRSAKEIRAAREAYLRREGNKLLAHTVEQRQPFAVLRLRVDRVKVLLHKTDTEFTKRSLYRISKLMEGETRRKDLLVRTGPADFVLVMPNTDPDEAQEVSKIIYRAMRHTIFQFESLKFRLTLSGGLAAPKVKSDMLFETILALADVRIERAFNAGGNQMVVEDLASEGVAKSLTLDEAATNLRSGKTSAVKQQIKKLLRKTMPILLFANVELNLGIDDALKKIHARLKQ